MRKVFILILVLVAAGCVEMSDHIGKRSGCAAFFNKQQFGEGVRSCDYYRISDSTYVVKNDTKDEVLKHIGTPEKIDYALGCGEVWLYKSRNVKLEFSGERLKAFGPIEENAH